MAATSDPLALLLPNETESSDETEAQFNRGIREITIWVLFGIILSIIAYLLLRGFRRREEGVDDAEEEIVYKISFAMCCFSLAVSAGSTLLLPVSSISNEVLHRYPESWYIKWLNSSLIHGIWNLIFILSNTSLFVLLPFAYLFCESEGFRGYKKGLLARAKETTITLLLLSVIIIGMMYTITALVDLDYSLDRLVNLYNYLPMLYSWVSFFGVLLLLICTPLGFARLFTVVGDLVVKPKTAKNLEEEYLVTAYEEDHLKCKLSGDYVPPMGTVDAPSEKGEMMLRYRSRLEETSNRRKDLSKIKKTSLWRRTVGYPLIMMLLFALTVFSLLCVVKNVGQIVAGFKTLPSQQLEEDSSMILGISSLSTLGAFGVFLEVVLIGYLFITSLVGLYTIPLVRNIKPTYRNTTLYQIILNCGLYLILSSALPLLAKILGITNFDLLGSFGKVRWLGNFYVVLLYNAIFAGATSLCLFNKFTARVRHEIMKRVIAFVSSTFSKTTSATIR